MALFFRHAPWLDRVADWPRYLTVGAKTQQEALLGDFMQSGYPLGSDDWVDTLETKSGEETGTDTFSASYFHV